MQYCNDPATDVVERSDVADRQADEQDFHKQHQQQAVDQRHDGEHPFWAAFAKHKHDADDEKLLDSLAQERKNIRKIINDIALYSNGSYSVRDMWLMPQSLIDEIQSTMIEKVEREKESMERAKGKNKQVF